MFGLFAPKPASPSAPDYPAALAALLVHVARADGHYAQAEIALIETVLADRFAQHEQDVPALREMGEGLEQDASDIVRFTRAIKEAVPYEQRIDVVRDLWRVVLADGARDMHEDGLMRLLANLLGVNDRDSAFARQQVVTMSP